MDEPLDESYFKWLYSQVGNARLKNPARTYWSFLRQLYNKEFVWFLANDDNREEDGKELRYEFCEAFGIHDVDQEWYALPCSMLELFIGLSRRLSFEAEGEPSDWFWLLLENLDLRTYNDRQYSPGDMPRIDHILENVNERRYSYDGGGGLFPLRHPEQDQTEVELWYQLQCYVLELEA